MGLSQGEFLKDYCKDCRYSYSKGGFFPEVEKSKIDDFRKKIKQDK